MGELFFLLWFRQIASISCGGNFCGDTFGGKSISLQLVLLRRASYSWSDTQNFEKNLVDECDLLRGVARPCRTLINASYQLANTSAFCSQINILAVMARTAKTWLCTIIRCDASGILPITLTFIFRHKKQQLEQLIERTACYCPRASQKLIVAEILKDNLQTENSISNLNVVEQIGLQMIGFSQ